MKLLQLMNGTTGALYFQAAGRAVLRCPVCALLSEPEDTKYSQSH